MTQLERKHPEAKCEECPLLDEQYVPGYIGENSRVAVVGEAPGFHETVYGRPFVGPSGVLLNKVLRSYGYDPRTEVTYTNATACRPSPPPGSPKANVAPPKAAINACRGRLLDELRTSGVSDLIAVGGPATSVTVDDPRSISHVRVGPPKQPAADLRLHTGVTRVVPTWHPAYCLRNADAFPTMVSDIGKLKGKPIAWSEPKWAYFEDPADARAVLEELLAFATHIVVDIEAGIEKDISFDHPNEFALLSVGLGYARGKVVVIGESALRDGGVLDRLRELLRRTKVIAHNGKFDLGGLYPHLGPLELWFDTMLASYALDERPGGHGLKVLGVERLGAPQWDQEIKKYIPKGGSYANIPRPILYKYNAYDVSVTWDLWELFTELLEQKFDWPYPDRPYKTLRNVHDFMVAASNQLMYLELNGITIDRVYQAQLSSEFLGRIETIEEVINNIVRKPVTTEDPSLARTDYFNPRSPKQIKEYLSTQGFNVASTNKDTLEQLLKFLQVTKGLEPTEPLVQFIITLLKHRREQKLYSTYVEGIRKRMYRRRVYTTYMLHGTTSGRLASRNPNLQNIVRDNSIRRQFTVAKPENIFVHCDFKQAEGRVIATLGQDEYLREIFSNPDIDIFDTLSDQLYGPGRWGKEHRIRTKAYFYGLSYGREEYSIAMEFGLSVHEAGRRMQEFMSLIPATVAWQGSVRDAVLAGRDLVTPFGRRRRFHLITEQNKKDVLKEALSFLPQSTASDICLDALTRVRPRLRGLGYVRLTIHDALMAECREADKAQVADILMEEMAAAGRRFTDYVPFSVDVSYGKTWGDV